MGCRRGLDCAWVKRNLAQQGDLTNAQMTSNRGDAMEMRNDERRIVWEEISREFEHVEAQIAYLQDQVCRLGNRLAEILGPARPKPG